MRAVFALLPFLVLALASPSLAAKKKYEASPKLIKQGKKLYSRYCTECHGEHGDGQGEGAKALGLVCRDFTQGVFEFRTTPSGYLPTEEDLYRTITKGIRLSMEPAKNMRPFKDLSRKKRWALVHYIKTFSPRWNDPEELAEPITIPEPPPATREAIARGKELWQKVQCWHCHGPEGRGDGPSAPGLKDYDGHPLAAADLSNLELMQGGSAPTDIYRAFTTGLGGTPMPSYGDSLDDRQRWDLVYFVLTFGLGEDGVLDRYGP
jgi:mono/diheme cytochrome c family protein